MFKQYFIYFVLLVMVCILTTYAYFNIREKEILFYQGESLYLKRNFSAAIGYYQQAVAKGYDDRNLVFHLGDSYTAERKFNEAASLYQKYLERFPNDQEAHIRYARVLSYTGNFDESSKEYKKVMEEKNAQ